MDDRDLNYNKYFTEGDKDEVGVEEYNSNNTKQLSKDEVKELLMTLPEFRAEMKFMGLL